MTDREPEDHQFSEGQGFDDTYEGFDLEPPEFEVDPDKVDPVDSRVLTDLLDRRNVMEEWDAAIGAYKEALNLGEESEAQRASDSSSGATARSDHAATAETNLAYALWESGRTEQALEHAERAVEIDPRFGEAWYNRGFFLLERGLAEDALDAFDNAIRLSFRNADVLEEKARALEELGEYDKAEELAEEVDEMREDAEQQLLE